MSHEHKRMRDHVRTQCFDILASAVERSDSAMSFQDLKQYMKGLSDEALEQGGLRDHEKMMNALENLREHAHRFANETIDMGRRVLREVRDAKGDDTSEASTERWQKILKKRKSGSDTWIEARQQIQEFLSSALPKLKSEWRQLRSDLKEVKTQSAVLGVAAKDMKELAALESTEFKNGKYPYRRKLVSAALRALKAREKSWKKRGSIETEGSRFYGEVRAYLQEAVDNGWMASAKKGEWLKRVFTGQSLAHARRNFQAKLIPFRNNWKQAREQYDELHGEMEKSGVPRGFSPVPPAAFLLKDYGQRMAYVRMLDARLHPNGKPASALSKDVWHAFDAEDWYDAERLIGVLETTFPSHPDLGAMVRYLESHRDDDAEKAEKKEGPTDDEIVKETNQIVGRYPQMDVLLEESLHKDTQNPQDMCARTRLVGRMMYNLVWAEQRGYTSEEEQFEEVHDAEYHAQTEEYIEEGHSDDVEKNMVWGSTADKHAIREDCSSAQIIYMKSDHDAQHVVANTVDKLRNNEKFGYWSDLKAIGMTNGAHHYFVSEDSKKLKKLVWQMRDRGIVYKRDTEVERRGGAAAQEKETEEKKAPAKAKAPQPALS